MEFMQEVAFETAIAIETRSLTFYRAVTSKVKDNKTRRVFELLAKEKADHLESFCHLYRGSEDELINIIGRNSINADPYDLFFLNSINGDTCEKDALRIALKEKQACGELYSAFVETIREPHVHDVFVRMLNKTNKHGEIIEKEYMRLMNMVDRGDQDVYVRETGFEERGRT